MLIEFTPPDQVHGWLRFQREGVTYYVIAYKHTLLPRVPDTNEWSARCSRFKAAEPSAVQAAELLMARAVQRLLRDELRTPPGQVAFVPALRSSETSANPNGGICRVTRASARFCGGQYRGDLLTKHSHEALHRSGTPARRAEVLAAAEYQCKELGPDVKTVLVFDDLVTTASTLRCIRQTILRSNPTLHVYGVALAQTQRPKYAAEHGIDISNRHVDPAWDVAWHEAADSSGAT